MRWTLDLDPVNVLVMSGDMNIALVIVMIADEAAAQGWHLGRRL